jgi:protein disulfide-isomerase A6
MKPDWDKLAAEYAASPSVVIGDVDCTVEKELCGKHGVKGYPTIQYFTVDKGKEGQKYQSGRKFDDLKKFVVDTLEVKCLVDAPEGCTEKETKFIAKFNGKDAEARAKELKRLEGMKGKGMKPELVQWLHQRINILKQLVEKDGDGGDKEEL